MAINGLLNQTISLYTKSGYNAYGRENVGAATSVKSRFQKQAKQKLLPNGSVIMIEAIAYVPSDTTVAIDDKVTYSSVDYKVYGIYTAVEGTGNTHHLKLELVKWKAT
ncbi:MAG: hypothetical protein JW735_09195 [Prolixibacteraceae bacterium]|nr:hypothetical protein [Prolixibacteraceae bacterium]